MFGLEKNTGKKKFGLIAFYKGGKDPCLVLLRGKYRKNVVLKSGLITFFRSTGKK